MLFLHKIVPNFSPVLSSHLRLLSFHLSDKEWQRLSTITTPPLFNWFSSIWPSLSVQLGTLYKVVFASPARKLSPFWGRFCHPKRIIATTTAAPSLTNEQQRPWSQHKFISFSLMTIGRVHETPEELVPKWHAADRVEWQNLAARFMCASQCRGNANHFFFSAAAQVQQTFRAVTLVVDCRSACRWVCPPNSICAEYRVCVMLLLQDRQDLHWMVMD